MAYGLAKVEDIIQEEPVFEKNFLDYEVPPYEDTYLRSDESRYFNLKIRNREYPSCYHYNVLVIAAKKLVTEENETECLNKKFSRMFCR